MRCGRGKFTCCKLQTSPSMLLKPSSPFGILKLERDTALAKWWLLKVLLATHYLRLACSQCPPRAPLWRDCGSAFRLLFRNLADHFQLDWLFAVYCLRRGGATYACLQHGSMEKTLLRGRWTSSSTARIYLQDTMATVFRFRLSPLQRAHVTLAAGFLYPL